MYLGHNPISKQTMNFGGGGGGEEQGQGGEEDSLLSVKFCKQAKAIIYWATESMPLTIPKIWKFN